MQVDQQAGIAAGGDVGYPCRFTQRAGRRIDEGGDLDSGGYEQWSVRKGGRQQALHIDASVRFSPIATI